MRVRNSRAGRWLAAAVVATACVTAVAAPASGARVQPQDSLGVTVFCASTFHAFTCTANVVGGHAPFTHAWSTAGPATVTEGNGKDVSGTCTVGQVFTVADHVTDSKGRVALGFDSLTCSDIL